MLIKFDFQYNRESVIGFEILENTTYESPVNIALTSTARELLGGCLVKVLVTRIVVKWFRFTIEIVYVELKVR